MTMRDERSLAEEQSLDGSERVAVFAQKRQRHRAREPLHGFGVDAESQCAGQYDVGGLFPVARQRVEYFGESVGLGIDALIGESREPSVDEERGYL